MGVFGIDTYREPSLIPPDEPEPGPTIECGAFLSRYTWPDGSISWKASDRFLLDYEQDRYEEAYEMAVRAMREDYGR